VLEAQARTTNAGRRAVATAKASGWWMIYDDVDDLVEPGDLAAALDAAPPARSARDGFPSSGRNRMPW